MRAFVPLTVWALATLARSGNAAPTPAVSPTSPAPATRQIIVQIAPETGTLRFATRRAALESRLASLGLRVAGALEDGLPAARGDLARSFASDAAARVFGLDARRVLLLEAPDPASAAAALLVLASDPEIEWAEPNQDRAPAFTRLGAGFPNDPLFRDTRQWGLRNVGPGGAYGGVAGADVHALEAWGWSTGSNDLLLAVADTGIDPDHPDLAARLPDGRSRVTLAMNVTSDPSRAVYDSIGHGTAITGVMAALTNNGAHHDSLGAAGVCGGDGAGNFGCRIVPIKISRDHAGSATAYDLSRAILYATRVGARALNLSFGGFSASRLERLALHEAITHGCVVVAAAGNAGNLGDGTTAFYPAAYAGEGLCVQVGASDRFDHRVDWSSHGPGLDLLAPGVDVWTTIMTYPTWSGALFDGYVAGSGTSFSAPFATGAVGLLASMRPELIDTDYQHVLRESADDVGAPGVDGETGWGRLNVARALASVAPRFGIWHDEVVAQTVTARGTDTLRVEEGGFGNLERARVSPLAELLELTATVAIPDSFLDSVRVWPRVGGTTTIVGDFRLPYFAPWSRVTNLEATSFTLRGYLYQLENCLYCTAPEDAWLPLPPDQARFGFTVIGRVDRPPLVTLAAPGPRVSAAGDDTLEIAWTATDPDQVSAIEIAWIDAGGGRTRVARLPGTATRARIPTRCSLTGTATVEVTAIDEHGRHHDRASASRTVRAAAGPCAEAEPFEASPNPFRGSTTIAASGATRLTIVDVGGRVVRRLEAPRAENRYVWDGRDSRGKRVEPGLYFVRRQGAAGTSERKVIKLD